MICDNYIDNHRYQVRLKAKDAANNWSEYSEVTSVVSRDSIAPPIPLGLKVNSVNDKQVTLGWTAVSAADLAGYNIEYEVNASGAWIKVGPLGKVTTTTITGLVNGTSYNFKISAFDTSGNHSEYSIPVTAIPMDKLPPAIPTGLTTIPDSNLDISLAWNRNTEDDFEAYELVYQKYGTATWTPVDIDESEASAKIEGLVYNVKYGFKIRAKDHVGNWSNYSSVVYATAKDLVSPGIPTFTSIVPKDKSLVVTWNTNPEVDLAGYQLEYNSYSA